MKSHPVFSHLAHAAWALSFVTAAAFAAPPVVKTVPWVASNPLIPHSTYSGRGITLKGTCDQSGTNLQWSWDFGDGAPVATGTVGTANYALGTTHVYSGTANTVFTARLTVTNTTTGESGSRAYYVLLQEKSLDVEVNIAIDEGLWYLHKTQNRSTSGGIGLGDWTGGYAGSGYYGLWAANLNAFEVNGHLESGDANNPYTETVQRGLRRLFQVLTTRTIPAQTLGNPDTNANGYGVCLNQSYQYYQGGMIIDAIVASGTPNAITVTGPAPVGLNPGILGRTYKSIVQDMVDDHAWAQYDDNRYGGWRYNAQDFPDNSACQWAAIGLIAAERSWGCVIPAWVKSSNVNWLAYTQTLAAGTYYGAFGYTSAGSYPWGPYASTPSGMVQMVMNGIGRDLATPAAPSWNAAETFIRNNFLNTTGGPTSQIKDYYYGLFSFVKAMLLHRTDLNNDGILEDSPIVLLRSQSANVPPIDWYAYENPQQPSAPQGVARTLVADQNSDGFWYGHNYDGGQYPFETAWAIMMLHKTLFESGVPVAVAKVVPNPSVAGQTLTLDGSDSYHQDATRSIVAWQWDLNSDGVFDATGPFATTSFAAVGSYPVKLRVTDSSVPARTAETIVTVRVATPPIAPTADANGPYVFCPEAKPWFVDGRRSVNPDEGQSEPHAPPYPGDTIQAYEWDLDGDGQFDDAVGPTPDVTAFFAAKGPGNYLITLKVTDTTAASYPSSGFPNLSNTATAQVLVQAGGCLCVTLTATPQLKEIALAWDAYPGIDHYNIHRATVSGGPYLQVGTVPAAGPRTFLDHPGILNQVYYYVVRPALANDDELCQSNQAAAEPLHPAPTVACTPTVVSNTAKYYFTLTAASQSFGRNQLQIFIGDTASAQVAGPFATEYLVYIRTNLPTPSVRPGSGSVKGYVMTKGSARVWAVDPISQKSTEVVVP